MIKTSDDLVEIISILSGYSTKYQDIINGFGGNTFGSMHPLDNQIYFQLVNEVTDYFGDMLPSFNYKKEIWSIYYEDKEGIRDESDYNSVITIKQIIDSAITRFSRKNAIEIINNSQSHIKVTKVPKGNIALSNRIFIVHGRNDTMKLSVDKFLKKFDLTPIILHEQPKGGQTIIEQIEKYSDVGFSIVCLSADDKGCIKDKFPNDAKNRGRQNVVFEFGYFVGKLGRPNVVALVESDEIEKPSDIDGVLYVKFDSAEGWCLAIAKELKTVGYDIDLNKLHS